MADALEGRGWRMRFPRKEGELSQHPGHPPAPQGSDPPSHVAQAPLLPRASRRGFRQREQTTSVATAPSSAPHTRSPRVLTPPSRPPGEVLRERAAAVRKATRRTDTSRDAAAGRTPGSRARCPSNRAAVTPALRGSALVFDESSRLVYLKGAFRTYPWDARSARAGVRQTRRRRGETSGGVRTSQTSPRCWRKRRTQNVRSTSHQRKPCRAELG
jgi:hypothetical protein